MRHSNLHILHVSTAQSWRGGERQLAFLAEELIKMGVKNSVLCPQGSALEKWCAEQAVPFFTFQKTFSLNPLVARHIALICRRQKITHLHAHDSHGHTFAVLAAQLFGNKTPLIVHRRVDFAIGKNRLSRWKYNHPAVCRIICVSHFIKKLVAPALCDPSKTRVVHDGIELFRPFTQNPKPKTRNSPPIIGNIAAIAPHKDYFTFVRTVGQLVAGGLSAKFQVIGGDGGEEAAIRAFIAEKKLNGHIDLLGFRTDVPALLARLDVLLFTSKTEGLGSSILDAMAAGVPVVATRAGGIPEIVEHETTGLLAPVGDAAALARQVRRMLEDPLLRRRILANARKRAQGFSKEKMAEQVLAVYFNGG